MKVLVTGSTDFIGRRLTKILSDNNHQIIALVRKSSNFESLLNVSPDIDIKFIEDNEIEKALAVHPIDSVIHAVTEYGRIQNLSTATFWTNVHLPMQLLDLFLKHKIPIFINLDIFLNHRYSNYDYLPGYTLSKRHFQEWGKYISETAPINFINLRLFHVYGPGDSEKICH